MRKNVFGRQFKRDANERKALFKNLLTSLVMEERIKTSTAKAKAIKAAADKLITKAKKGGRDAYRALEAEVNHNAVIKLIDDIAPRFAGRAGGYTRIIKIGNRVADNAPESVMEWTEKKVVKEIVAVKEPKTTKEAKPKKETKAVKKKEVKETDEKKTTKKKPVKEKK